MRVRDRGFALILVLVAVVGVFALAMQGAIMARSATIESRVMRERAEGERIARSAALVVLLGLAGGESGEAGPGASGSGFGGAGSSGGSASPPQADKPKIELPPIVRELLGDRAKELEQGAEQNGNSRGLQRASDGGGFTGRPRSSERLGYSKKFALPASFIELQVTEAPDAPRCRVWLSDAVGQLDLHTVSEEEIGRYFQSRVQDTLLAASLTDEFLDWRDEDDFMRPRGAEQPTYRQRGASCRNGLFESREELLFLPSMTRELFERMKDDFSISSDGKVHAGSASPQVLACLTGMTADVVEAIIKLRNTGALTAETLKEALPLFSKESQERLRAEPSTVVRVRVEVLRGKGEGDSMKFEGLAIAGDSGVRAVGLKPL